MYKLTYPNGKNTKCSVFSEQGGAIAPIRGVKPRKNLKGDDF